MKSIYALRSSRRNSNFSVALYFCFCFRERLPFLDHACQQNWKNLSLVLKIWEEIYIRNDLKPNRIPSSVLWLTFKPLKAAVTIGSDSTFKAARPASGWNVETGSLQKSYEKLPGNSSWTLVNWRQNWLSEIEEVLRYATAQKSSQESEQKSMWKYVRTNT